MTSEDEELMLDNFVTFFIAGESCVVPALSKKLQNKKNTSPNILMLSIRDLRFNILNFLV